MFIVGVKSAAKAGHRQSNPKDVHLPHFCYLFVCINNENNILYTAFTTYITHLQQEKRDFIRIYKRLYKSSFKLVHYLMRHLYSLAIQPWADMAILPILGRSGRSHS